MLQLIAGFYLNDLQKIERPIYDGRFLNRQPISYLKYKMQKDEMHLTKDQKPSS